MDKQRSSKREWWRRSGCYAVIVVLLGSMIYFTFPYRAEAALGDRGLWWGTRGQDVSELQWRLQQLGYTVGPIDGVFGAQTNRAVRAFQGHNRLRVDGVVGKQTANLLLRATGAAPRQAATPQRTVQAPKRSDDLYMLARLINGEARGEPYLGKVAVGAVILNRVKHPSFPQSIAGVVYQPRAFEAIATGQAYLQPDATSLKAATDALNGWDPTGGAIYFWNPYKPVSAWIWTRTITGQIGRHVFGR